MKQLKFLVAVCCMAAVFTACEKNEPIDNTNGNGINTDQNGSNSNTDSSGSVSAPTGTENGHGYVNLGLPSGLKWATCNVGATAPEGYGDYFAWGETTPKDDYRWHTYKWATATYSYGDWDLETLTKYNTSSSRGTIDNKTVLDLEDDAAAVNWGGAWRMPTDAEWTELCENCAWTWTTLNGVNGYEVKGTNGNSIFLPAAGFLGDNFIHAGSSGSYWSSSLNTDFPDLAWNVYFCSDGVDRYNYIRCFGRSVRPVLGE